MCDNEKDGKHCVLEHANSSKILKSEVKNMIVNIVLIVQQDCDFNGFPCDSYHHTNVEVRTEVADFNMQGSKYGSLDIYSHTLADKMKGTSTDLSDERILSILKQLVGGVERLHKMKKAHGRIIPEHVFISKDERNHPFLCGVESNNNDAELMHDVRDLGMLFYYVLTHGSRYDRNTASAEELQCDEKDTAWDLISKMVDKRDSFTCADILVHPLFWGEDQKLQFVIDLYDSVSHSKRSIEILESGAKKAVFQEDGWKEKLKVTSREKRKFEELNSGESIDMDKIYQLAGGTKTKRRKNITWSILAYDGKVLKSIDGIEDKKWKRMSSKMREVQKANDATIEKRIEELLPSFNDLECNDGEMLQVRHILGGAASNNEQLIAELIHARGINRDDCEIFGNLVLCKTEEDGGYDKSCFYDLLRFIRNKKAHGCEMNQQAKMCFQAAGGYWRFFITRFPTLLIFLFNHLEHFPHYRLNVNT